VAYVGDKIIFDENKPLLGVMNGTMGIVRVVGDDTFLLDTGEDLKELPKGVATQASLGYAITVHRSQGSEWPAVILVLPESPLTTRKVVYTALTRAKQQAVLLSVPDLENHPLPKDRRRRTYLSLVAPAEGGEEE
jgi:ATP-dependent exoDNAse (exonuclease V), alpha subunit - helicase superfamily I member